MGGMISEEKRIGYGDFWDRPARVTTRRFLENGDVSDKEYKITASVGSATALIDNELDVEKLISEADNVMYIDKKQRKQGR